MNTNRTCVSLTAIISFLAILMWMVTGCASRTPTGHVVVSGSEAVITGAPAIDVENHNGSVTIIVDPTQPRPEVIAIPRGDSRSDPSHWTAASMVDDAGHQVLRVLSSDQSEGANARPIDMVIRLPSCGGVRVRNQGGIVVLTNVAGAIDVDNTLTRGDVRSIYLVTNQPLNSPVILRTNRGDVEARVPVGSSGRIEASAPRGRVAVRGIEAPIHDVRLTHEFWTGILNNASNDIRITSDAGNVSLSIMR